MKEIVLYYAPENAVHVGLIKGVLVQMEIGIKNLTPGRCEKKIGCLAGLDGFENEDMVLDIRQTRAQAPVLDSVGINEELLVLCGFTEERLDQLLGRLKNAGVPKSVMKAIVTESNAHWSVYELYSHLTEERRQLERRKRFQ